MKHRRAWISLLAVCALLGQTLAVAWAMPMNLAATSAQAQQSQEEAMPCHSGTAQDDATCCCDDVCDCAAMCGGGSALTSSAVLPSLTPAADPTVSAVAVAAIPAYILTPLRPPITSQS